MKRFLRFCGKLAIILTLAIIALRLIFALPDISNRPASTALPADPATPLGAIFAKAASDHPGLTAVYPLSDGHDALGSRLELAAQAQHSIDAQYYIWHDDISGNLLLKALYDAAQRGVRVRLLLDDNGIPGLDPTLAALNALPNFDIRLFNPSTIRSPKLAGYTFDFFRMNRRMHNKSFLVDGAAAIIGGRNIGDEYFRVGDENFYLDMDVLGIGAITPQTAAVFDQYWNSASVFALESIVTEAGDLPAFLTRAETEAASPAAAALRSANATTLARVKSAAIAPEWAQVQLVADDPAKGSGTATQDQLMITRLGEILGDIQHNLDLASAYFVPGDLGTAYFADLTRQGRQVRILTNALNTTDVLMVHAGYTKYRRALLEAGVQLYELKLRSNEAPDKPSLNPFGFSGASLHAKTFAIDDRRVFIGSFNFDPRSALLNCEMGFLIDSPDLASRVTATFANNLDKLAYRPQLTPEGKMVWQETTPEGKQVIYQEEPGATWFQQIAIVIIGILPVEWLL